MLKFLTLLLLLLAPNAHAGTYDSYPAISSTDGDEVTLVLDDPSGTPATAKITLDGIGAYILGYDSGTITADAPVLDLAQTWNNAGVTFSGVNVDITDTASAPGSHLVNINVDGSPIFQIDKDGTVRSFKSYVANTSHYVGLDDDTGMWAGASYFIFNADGTEGMRVSADGAIFPNGTSVSWGTGGVANTRIYNPSAGVLEFVYSTTPHNLDVFNYRSSASNWEKLRVGWDTNVAELGTSSAGTGSDRALSLQTGATDRLKLDTVGSVEVATALTVATLPGTPAVGMIARVTDADTPSIGSTVTGGGAAAALVWYNGAAWTVIGI